MDICGGRSFFLPMAEALRHNEQPIPYLAFDSKENNYLYLVKVGNQVAMVHNGQMSPAYRTLSLPVFSPNAAM